MILFAACLAALPTGLPAQAPAHWTSRPDRPGAVSEFSEMPPGFHLTSGAAGATFVPDGSRILGRRIAETRVVLFPGTGAEGFGITLVDLDAPARSLGFLIRRSGEAAVVARDGDRETVLVPWAAHAAIKAPDSTGYATNALRLELTPATIRFLVNGAEVLARPRDGTPARMEAGFRIGAGLNMHVTTFDLGTPMVTPAARKGG